MQQRNHTTLYKLQSIVKERLEQAMPMPCWVTAEISELKVNYSGHCYIELVEKGGDNRVPRARASAVAWRSTWGALSAYFRSETGAQLAEGMNVLLRVSVSYHELYGLSFVISDIDPLYTLGDMQRQRQQTIDMLQQDGIFDMNREVGFPPVVQRIAVVSSRNAAGYQDFMNELGASAYRFDTTLFDAFMQGQGAEDSIVAAMEEVAANAEKFDTMVLIRGGGAVSDLAAFDSYRLCSHIAQFPLPVITGIGHDKDESVADMVAAIKVKTPTAAAAYLVSSITEFDLWLDSMQSELLQETVSVLDEGRRKLREAGFRLSRQTDSLTRSLEIRLERLKSEIALQCRQKIAEHNLQLSGLDNMLSRNATSMLSDEKLRLATAEKMLDGRRPENILSLGFAIVRKNGAAITDSRLTVEGEKIEITFAHGSAEAEITKTNQ